VVAAAAGGVEAGGVQHRADLVAPGRQCHVAAATDGGRARVGAHQAQQHPQGGGLAGAVGTQEPEELPTPLARSLRDLFRRHPQAAPLLLRCSALPRSQLELFKAYLEVLEAGGLREPAAILRPVISYAVGYGYAERSMLGVQCQPNQGRARPRPTAW
jgi:Tetracyclin repressor-like, C-terminal domain